MNGMLMNSKAQKPCHELHYCPYGPLVEEYRIPETAEETKYGCKTFDHICPVFFVAQDFATEWHQEQLDKGVPQDDLYPPEDSTDE